MAILPTLLNDTIAEYAETIFSSETAFLKQLLIDAENEGIPPISIGGLQGSFLQTFIRTMNASTVVEIGSLAGYSALTMAMALPAGGKVYCFEINPDYAAFIEKKAEEAGLFDKISVIVGPALEMIPTIKFQSPIDILFIDADKPNYSRYFEALHPHIRSGGAVIGDNALAWGYIADDNPSFEPENVQGLQQFNALISGHSEYHPACLVPLGDGMAIAIKK